MKPMDMIVRVYGERKGGQWFLIALDFDLAVQSDDLSDAKHRLTEQICDYLNDLVGQDRKHAARLLTRTAPLKYRLKYWYYSKFPSRNLGAQSGSASARQAPKAAHKAYAETLPMAPVCPA